MTTSYSPVSRSARDSWHRPAAAIGGAGFLIASAASYLAIGNLPRPDTSPADLTTYYLAHHAHVQAGGLLLALAGALFTVFGTALSARIRQASGSTPLAALTFAGTILVAVTTMTTATVYGLLGDIGGMHGISAGTLQAWHVLGSAGSVASGVAALVFLAAVAAAGFARAVPRFLAWSGLVLAVLGLAPGQAGFLVSLVFLAWTAAAGIVVWRSRTAPEAVPAGHRVPSERAPA